MLDIKFIRENPDIVKEAAQNKGIKVDVEELLKVDRDRRDILTEMEALRADQNKKSKDKPTEEEIEALKSLKSKIQELQNQLTDIEINFNKLMLQVPSIPKEDVHVGKNDTENKIIRSWGNIPKFSFEPKDHLELGENLGILDMERATKVSGARFAYLKGDGVLLELAIVNYVLTKLISKGFVPVIPPVLIKKESMEGMGYLEHGGEEDMYVLEKENLILVGTSEQSIGPMHKDEILDKASLPIRYVGFSPCFRKEAGSYGKDTRGIIRMHQFDKVEMFSITLPENSDEEHEFLLNIEEEILQDLGLPYQVSKMCTGDLGAPVARKYDLEAWIPTQNKYRELTSSSTTTDFQSRRMGIKYREGEGSNFVHMLNGTGVAVGRTMVAILENYQQEDGSIKIPEILQKYLGKDTLTK